METMDSSYGGKSLAVKNHKWNLRFEEICDTYIYNSKKLK